ncbi:MAG TPA: AMP-binding protein, partial [Acidimicrobiales bacterium]|nr:AMP-binding protein [Acidimicrobiales bacterium]
MNLATILDGHPDGATALITRGKPTTYGELRAQVDELRGGLARLGVGRGDRVAILLPNNGLFPVAYLATIGLGGVAVLLNPQSPATELQAELAAVRPKVAFVGASAGAAFADVDRAAAKIEHVVTPEGVSVPGAVDLTTLQGGAPVPVVDVADGDLAVLVFTSGTAGNPKAAMLSHGNLRANLDQVQQHPGRALNPGDVSLGVLPLFHIFGLNVVLGLSLVAGASVVLVERFDPA